MTRQLRHVIAVIGLSLLFAALGYGQSFFGSITGVVSDPTKAVVPGAEVSVINAGTGMVRRVTTGSTGTFNVPTLDLGAYTVRVAAKGFETFERTGLQLAANQVLNVDVQLVVGSTASLVEVHAATPAIATETTDLSGALSQQAAQQLPMQARQYADAGMYMYSLLNPGVAGVQTSSIPAIGGARLETGTIPTIDGISVMAYPQGASPVQPSLDSVEEIKVETFNAPAEFALAGNIQEVTRGGTNQFHGGAFYDYNGNALNSRSFFSPSVAFRVYNDFGASLAGPIKKNKLFFFFVYEGSRCVSQTTLVQSEPLASWLNGNFSGISTVINNPFAVTPTGQKVPFTGNIIPQNLISPVSTKVENALFPSPNAGSPTSVTNNFVQNAASTGGFTNWNMVNPRVDYNPTSRDSIFVRLDWRRIPRTFIVLAGMPVPQVRYDRDATSSWSHAFSPLLFNEFRFGATYHRNYYQSLLNGSQLLQQFGITGLPSYAVNNPPDFTITGVTGFAPDSVGGTYQDNPDTTLEATDNLIWTKGSHVMKYGVDVIRERLGGNNIASSINGNYSFSGTFSGLGYADFLLGIPQTTAVTIPNPSIAIRGTTMGIYAQDQFRVTHSLTVNYGLRWELEFPYTSKHSDIFNFDPKTGALVVPNQGLPNVNPFYPKNIPIETASQGGFPANSLLAFNKGVIFPRVGFAYKPFGGDKTVIRGGYGIYNNLIYNTLSKNAMVGGPFSGSVTYTNKITNGVPLFSFPSPFLTSGTTATQNVAGTNPNVTEPYTQQWNITIEHQFGSGGLRVSYLGSRSVQLIYRRNLNQPVASLTTFSASEEAYPLYNVVTYGANGGNQLYNGLEVQFQKKYGQNFTWNVGWTWAKDLTDTQDAGSGGTTFGGPVIQNTYLRSAEEANSSITPNQRVYAYALYSLPVGQGQRFLSNPSKVVQGILGGWRTTWTMIAQSGPWFTPTFSGFDTSHTNTIGGRPDYVAGQPLYPANKSIHEWFNPAAFAIPGCPSTTPVCTSSQIANVGRFGDAGQNILQGPSLVDFHFGLMKSFAIRENMRLDINVTAENVLNHPDFTSPSANISATSTVGVISGTASAAYIGNVLGREIDLGMRLTF